MKLRKGRSAGQGRSTYRRRPMVVTQRANGGKLIQTYTLDQGAGLMIISTQASGERLDGPIELRFVFDAEAGR
jgi:hypothetical protein